MYFSRNIKNSSWFLDIDVLKYTVQNIATMDTNEKLREEIFEIINNQLSLNDPPETKTTFDKLLKQGYDDFQITQMIGKCISVELFDVIKHGKSYNNERYIMNLIALPKEPFD